MRTAAAGPAPREPPPAPGGLRALRRLDGLPGRGRKRRSRLERAVCQLSCCVSATAAVSRKHAAPEVPERVTGGRSDGEAAGIAGVFTGVAWSSDAWLLSAGVATVTPAAVTTVAAATLSRCAAGERLNPRQQRAEVEPSTGPRGGRACAPASGGRGRAASRPPPRSVSSSAAISRYESPCHSRRRIARRWFGVSSARASASPASSSCEWAGAARRAARRRPRRPRSGCASRRSAGARGRRSRRS